jgi:hypothetical protein
MDTLSTAFMAVFWNTILSRTDKVSKLLQDPSLDFCVAVQLLQSLEEFFKAQRDKFSDFCKAAKTLCGHANWKHKRARRPKVQADDSKEPAIVLIGEEAFKIGVFYAIIDSIVGDLHHRIEAYTKVKNRFAFLMVEQEDAVVQQSLLDAADFYKGDIDIGIVEEWTQWSAFLKGLSADWPTPQQMLHRMCSSHIESAFPNVFTALRIYLTLPVSNCTGERSYSHMKRIKSNIRATMGQDRLSYLSLLNIESDLLMDVDFTELIHGFAAAKSRRRYVV